MNKNAPARDDPPGPACVDRPAAPFTMFFDGACPFCEREVSDLRRRDDAGRLRWVDIDAPDFDARRYGLDPDAVRRTLHGLEPDGRVVRGLDVSRRAWRAVGRERLARATERPGVRPLLDALYRLFARVRVPLGRALRRLGL